jgi:hypothetical protein
MMIMAIKEIWFDKEHIYGKTDDGKTVKQSLLWYSKLLNANDEERNNYIFGLDGIHWRNLDEDMSFESFGYDDSEPSPMQRFFLTHKELKVSEFAKRVGMNETLLRNYINGFKKPSSQTVNRIMKSVNAIGKEYAAAIF